MGGCDGNPRNSTKRKSSSHSSFRNRKRYPFTSLARTSLPPSAPFPPPLPGSPDLNYARCEVRRACGPTRTASGLARRNETGGWRERGRLRCSFRRQKSDERRAATGGTGARDDESSKEEAFVIVVKTANRTDANPECRSLRAWIITGEGGEARHLSNKTRATVTLPFR